MTIWKYEIEPDLVNQVYDLPAGAQVLSFGLDPVERLCFWALVEEEAPKEARVFACVGTGWNVEEGARFVGTAVKGEYVWHLFEVRKRS